MPSLLFPSGKRQSSRKDTHKCQKRVNFFCISRALKVKFNPHKGNRVMDVYSMLLVGVFRHIIYVKLMHISII